jgi:AbrB family looped-hinge helix DNA binding protein
MESAITVKGQTTIPKAIRQHLGLKPGDRVKFFLHPNGSVVLLPKIPTSALRGILKSSFVTSSRTIQFSRSRRQNSSNAG